MWFIWFMWTVTAIAVILTVVLLTGKGSMLVTGFNTKSSEDRAGYDKTKVSRRAGLFMLLIDAGLIALTLYIHLRAVPAIQNGTVADCGTEITVAAFSICAYIIAIGIIAAARGFKGCEKR